MKQIGGKMKKSLRQVRKVSYKLWLGPGSTVRYNTYKDLIIGIKKHIDARITFEILITYRMHIKHFLPFDNDFQIWKYDGVSNTVNTYNLRECYYFKRNNKVRNNLFKLMSTYGW